MSIGRVIIVCNEKRHSPSIGNAPRIHCRNRMNSDTYG